MKIQVLIFNLFILVQKRMKKACYNDRQQSTTREHSSKIQFPKSLPIQHHTKNAQGGCRTMSRGHLRPKHKTKTNTGTKAKGNSGLSAPFGQQKYEESSISNKINEQIVWTGNQVIYSYQQSFCLPLPSHSIVCFNPRPDTRASVL